MRPKSSTNSSFRLLPCGCHDVWRAIRPGGLALLIALFFAGCLHAPAEQRLRETITGMEAAVETGDIGGVLEGVSVDFTGNQGQYDRRQLHALLRGIVLRHPHIGVALGPLEITLHGETRATVKVTAVLTGGSGGWLPETGRRIDIDSGWRDEDGRWRCISAIWRE